MAHTRLVTGTIHLPTGEPWPDFAVQFTLRPSATTVHATLPQHLVVATTGVDGTFSVSLEVDVAYEVGLSTAFLVNGSSIQYPPGTVFMIVVPDGTTPISLEAIRASAITPVDAPTIVDFAANHLADMNNPHQVTAAQVGAYTTGETDALIGGGIPTALTDLDTTVTGAQLDGIKFTVDGLGTVATHDVAEFATSTQGATADTAIQPGDLGIVATSNQYGDLTGIPSTFSPGPHDHDSRYPLIGDVNNALAGKAPAILTTKGDLYGRSASESVRVPVGTDGQVLIADSANASGVGWDTRKSFVGWAPGDYVTPEVGPLGCTGAGNRNTGNNFLMVPVEIPSAGAADMLSAWVITGSASGLIRLGLFTYDFVTATVVLDGGTVSSVTTGQKNIIINENLDPGMYWLGVASNQSVILLGSRGAFGWGRASDHFGDAGNGYLKSYVWSGAGAAYVTDGFPSTITGLNNTGVNEYPRLGIRRML